MPLDPKLTKFTTASPVIATYNYTEIADGTGIIIFYGSTIVDDTSTEYVLNQNIIPSRTPSTSEPIPANTDSYAQMLDLDFDLAPFNSPRTIEGRITVIAKSTFQDFGTGVQGTYMICKVRKWDGSTETTILTIQSDTVEEGADQGVRVWKGIIPKTHFAKGDILRMTMEEWGKNTNNATPSTSAISHDPRDVAGTDDELIFHVPFELNI